MFNILDYGAVGDGETLDHKAIQAAVDACHEAGGGRVLFPAGHVFLAGPFHFRSHVHLLVESGAVLKASADLSLYGESAFKENLSEGAMWISGREAQGIGISGGGVIDGQGRAFMMGEVKTHYLYEYPDGVDRRPHLLTLIGCRNVTIREVTFRDAAYWCLHPVGCEDVLIAGVRILNSLKLRNADGIDIDHCRNVRISDCYIESADDCICLKTRREYAEYGPTENVTVTGCTLVSTSCAVKLGSENISGIRNAVFSSLTISASNRGLGIQNRDEGAVENILFSDILVESRLFGEVWWGKAEPISVTAFKRPPEALRRFAPGETEGRIGPVRHIRFRNIQGDCENGAYLCGCADARLEDIRLDQVSLRIARKTAYPGGVYDRRPCDAPGIVEEPRTGFFVQEADEVTLQDCGVTWEGELSGRGWAERDTTDVEVRGFRERSRRAGGTP